MKKAFFFAPLLFFSLISFGQDKINLNVDKKVEITTKKDLKKGLGLTYLGSGVYRYGKTGPYNSSESQKKLEKTYQEIKTYLIIEINKFTERNNYDYKITVVENVGSAVFPIVLLTFKVTNKDGSEVILKIDAKNQLLELKEYLDLGIITQDEFEKKTVFLKKILLGN